MYLAKILENNHQNFSSIYQLHGLFLSVLNATDVFLSPDLLFCKVACGSGL
jgi:hypothetical protein